MSSFSFRRTLGIAAALVVVHVAPAVWADDSERLSIVVVGDAREYPLFDGADIELPAEPFAFEVELRTADEGVYLSGAPSARLHDQVVPGKRLRDDAFVLSPGRSMAGPWTTFHLDDSAYHYIYLEPDPHMARARLVSWPASIADAQSRPTLDPAAPPPPESGPWTLALDVDSFDGASVHAPAHPRIWFVAFVDRDGDDRVDKPELVRFSITFIRADPPHARPEDPTRRPEAPNDPSEAPDDDASATQ